MWSWSTCLGLNPGLDDQAVFTWHDLHNRFRGGDDASDGVDVPAVDDAFYRRAHLYATEPVEGSGPLLYA